MATSTTYAQESDLGYDDVLLAQLTDSPMAVGVKNEAAVQQAGADAQALIDAKLQAEYVVPLQPIAPAATLPDIVRMITRDIWRRILFERRPTMPMPEVVAASYDRAMKLLDDYVDHDSGLVLACVRMTGSSSPTTTGGALDPKIVRIFGRGNDGLGG